MPQTTFIVMIRLEKEDSEAFTGVGQVLAPRQFSIHIFFDELYNIFSWIANYTLQFGRADSGEAIEGNECKGGDGICGGS